MTALSRYITLLFCLLFLCAPVGAQSLLKSAQQVDAGNTKAVGQNFVYRLTYNCSNTSGPCLGAEVVDLLPAAVQLVSTVPASPSGDVAAIDVTNNYMGTGRTRVRFDLIDPLPAGNSGDLLITVRFPAGTTPDGTAANNTADAINLGTTPGTFTTPPVTVTAVATAQATLTKTLQTSPANLDTPESYRLRTTNSGNLNFSAVGPIVDTLPAGTVFNGATPAAACEPACIGTTPATLTWNAPCTVPLAPGSNCDITVNVTFPTGTFSDGQSVTNSFTTTATPLGSTPQNYGPATVNHTVTGTALATLTKTLNGTANVNTPESYRLRISAPSGGLPLTAIGPVTDTLPADTVFNGATPAADCEPACVGTTSPALTWTAPCAVPLAPGSNCDIAVNVTFTSTGSRTNNFSATITPSGLTPQGFGPAGVTHNVGSGALVTTGKTLQTSPANLDVQETYRLRISAPGGGLPLTAIGPVTDTLPSGAVFNGATPAADCEPACVGTTPASVTWTAPCTVPLNAGQNCDITVRLTYPSSTFTDGQSVTNSFSATVTPSGLSPQTPSNNVTHPVTLAVANPSFNLQKNVVGSATPTVGQAFTYEIIPNNNGNVSLDNLVIIDTLPVEFQVTSVTTGRYNNLSNLATGVGVRVSYEKNTAPGVFTTWGSSPNTTTNTTLTAPPPGLGAGEYLTRLRWEFGAAAAGMVPSNTSDRRPQVRGSLISPDNAGNSVIGGDSIENCVQATAVYTAGPTNVDTGAVCRTFNVTAQTTQFDPAKELTSGTGPYAPGQTVSYRLRVRTTSSSNSAQPLDGIIVSDLLPLDLNYTSWSFDAQSTGLPAPQTFEQLPNYAGTGRTLLRWRWNSGSGNLAINSQVWINLTTTVRNGATAGSLTNTVTVDTDTAGYDLTCASSSQSDALDLDGDGNSAETVCSADSITTIAAVAQLISSKLVAGICDSGPTNVSQGTLPGGAIEYSLRVENVGSVAMENFVIIDILPFVGDTGVRDTNPRDSQWTPLLTAPITPPPGTTLYYSTAGNPCRGEVGGPTSGCTAPNWTTVPPEPITSVRAFKVEFGDAVVEPLDFINMTFTLTTPGQVPAGQIAYNSFAYQAERSDGLGALAAEPQKVGIAPGSCSAAGLGDFVWIDDDQDGGQGAGETGLNGVPMTLFSVGNDGIARSQDDEPLAVTVTNNGPDNAPGWYSFPGLTPGSYYVCMDIPGNYTPSPANQPSPITEALDSDGDPLSGCSEPVTLGFGEYDPDIDFGLYPAGLAGLGNYVWFDRNNNGIQDDSAFDGANGVTVNLYQDDGDNSANPAVDTLLSSTVTADNGFGQPGYYRFTGLQPGTYFVEFVLPSSATGFTSANVGNDALDSDALPGSGLSGLTTLSVDEIDNTLDAGLVAATNILSLGDQVWQEADNDGLYEPENGELGVNNVRLDLYLDSNSNGRPDMDEFLDSTLTTTAGGVAGRYQFADLAPGNYLVVVPASNFNGGAPLFGLVSSDGNEPTPDPDDDVNGDDNGALFDVIIASRAVTLTLGGEPISEDGDDNSNLTVDFGFTNNPLLPPPAYDYGDAPDAGSGTGAGGNYNTTTFDGGPLHDLSLNGPYLGDCVDADNGLNQDTAAQADNLDAFAGDCIDGNDEDGVVFNGPLALGTPTSISVRAGGGTCTLNAWIDWNRNGVFGDVGNETIANNVSVPSGAPVVLTPTVPVNAMLEATYARFRCSTDGNLSPTGPVSGAIPDGEVEDYLLASPSSATPFSLGNYVWLDDGAGGGVRDDGIRNGTETGIANVLVELLDGTGAPVVDGGSPVTATTSASGYYLFSNLDEGSYRVRVAASNFQAGGALAGLRSSTGVRSAGNDQQDKGLDVLNATTTGISSSTETLSLGTEPTGEAEGGLGAGGSADDNSNLTIDFGFVSGPLSCSLLCDYDQDSDVDSNDIRLISTQRGRTVTPGSLGDCNNDGILSVNDASLCRTFCTRANCAQ